MGELDQLDAMRRIADALERIAVVMEADSGTTDETLARRLERAQRERGRR